MEELEEGNPSPSMLTDSIVSNLKTEFEKRGILKFTPELEGKLTKCLNETFEGIERKLLQALNISILYFCHFSNQFLPLY